MILLIEKNNMDEAAEILATTTPILDSWIGTSTLTESLRVFELVLKVAFLKDISSFQAFSQVDNQIHMLRGALMCLLFLKASGS